MRDDVLDPFDLIDLDMTVLNELREKELPVRLGVLTGRLGFLIILRSLFLVRDRGLFDHIALLVIQDSLGLFFALHRLFINLVELFESVLREDAQLVGLPADVVLELHLAPFLHARALGPGALGGDRTHGLPGDVALVLDLAAVKGHDVFA